MNTPKTKLDRFAHDLGTKAVAKGAAKGLTAGQIAAMFVALGAELSTMCQSTEDGFMAICALNWAAAQERKELTRRGQPVDVKMVQEQPLRAVADADDADDDKTPTERLQ